MGCGKTYTVIDSLRKHEVYLVCCPVAVGASWAKELAAIEPERSTVVACEGPVAKRAEAIADAVEAGGPLAVVVNYDSVWRPAIKAILEGLSRLDAIVLDEAHRIKSPTAKVSKFLHKLSHKFHPNAKRICLSGTPTPNSPFDWWSQFRFLGDEILGKNYPAFQRRIATMHPQLNFPLSFSNEGLSALQERIDNYVHRVKSEDVLSLPEAVHAEIAVKQSAKAAKFYKTLEREAIAELENGEVVSAANRLVITNRLMMATSGFARSEESPDVLQPIDGTPDKAVAFADWLDDFPPREPLVVIAVRHVDIDSIIDACQKRKRTVGELSGRRKDLARWQAGDLEVLVVQMQAGNAGIDLTRSSHMVYYSINHSNGDYLQSLARIRRPGQAKCCRYYHFICTDTVDADVYQALEKKQDIVDAVMDRLTKRAQGESQ
jgi:SNF2 family DNA or RNA helicase